MLVKNLVAWAGHDFSYAPGEHIDLPEAIAKARITAGIAAPADEGAALGDNLARLKLALSTHTAKNEELERTLANLRSEHGDVTSHLAAYVAHAEALRKQLLDAGMDPSTIPSAPSPVTEADDGKVEFLEAVEAAASKQRLRDLGALNDIDLSAVADKMDDLRAALVAHADRADRVALTIEPAKK